VTDDAKFTINLSADELVVLTDLVGRWKEGSLGDLKIENDAQRHVLLGLWQELVPHSWFYQDRDWDEVVAESEQKLVEFHGQLDRQD
jgi:hypothetical protein